MKIKNANLAGATLGLKSGPVTGDDQGVFDIPDEEAKALLDTPGWGPAKKAAAIEPPADDDLTEEVNAAVDEVTLDEGEPDDTDPDDEDSEIDLDAMTKSDLVAFAEDHGIEIDPYALKADIKEAIEAALNGGD